VLDEADRMLDMGFEVTHSYPSISPSLTPLHFTLLPLTPLFAFL
jgi:hypothetical protein